MDYTGKEAAADVYRLVVVDDEVEIRNGIAQYFPWREIGFQVCADFENGQDALSYIARHDVDVVLCDIRMPVMNGMELTRELHRTHKQVKVVFLTGYKDFEYVKQALIYGAKNYIVKPTAYEELYQVFSKLKAELDEERGSRAQPAETPEESSLSEKVVQTVQEYIRTRYRDANLEDAAARVHMNPQYLSTYFKEKTGESFSNYLLRVKMEAARKLLMNIQYKTYEVSELVGYSNAKNFTRAFKNYFGESPKEFRNR